ncbi:MAG: hypothetical protein AAF756_20605 [Pseudomonadota bacterium]
MNEEQRIVATLRAEAAQENCDGEPYDTMVEAADLIDSLIGVLYQNGFERCNSPACNCGSWHHVGGFKLRFDEIEEATEDYWRNGETLLDRIKRIAAERASMEVALNEACTSEAYYGIDPPERWLKALGLTP